MYIIEDETNDIRFELVFDKYFEEDAKMGNPYNTLIYVSVRSFGFCGRSKWTVDIKEFKSFIGKLKEIYDKLSGEVNLTDRVYGSFVNIKCSNSGKISFKGKLRDEFQKLEFQFELDQTHLRKFVEKIYNDYK